MLDSRHWGKKSFYALAGVLRRAFDQKPTPFSLAIVLVKIVKAASNNNQKFRINLNIGHHATPAR